MTIEELMRSDLGTLDPYPPPRSFDEIEARLGRPIVKLDANENPYGAAPGVASAMAGSNSERYPDAECTALRMALGDYLETEPERIICSVGGDELLDFLMRLFIEPGDEVIDCTPQFVMYRISTEYNRGKLLAVPRTGGFVVDVAAVERAVTDRTRIIFLCSPNNPTGNPTPLEDILRVLETGRIVVLDEAYAEFAGRTHVGLAREYPNLVVLRTMSKWAALAGQRIGYAVLDPGVVEAMRRVKSPYNLSAAAQAAGVASLCERDYLMANVQRIVAERERLRERLAALSFGTVYPSETNFLYWTTGELSARALREALFERGVLVRAFHDPVDALRFSVGTPWESDVLLAALEEAYAEITG